MMEIIDIIPCKEKTQKDEQSLHLIPSDKMWCQEPLCYLKKNALSSVAEKVPA